MLTGSRPVGAWSVRLPDETLRAGGPGAHRGPARRRAWAAPGVVTERMAPVVSAQGDVPDRPDTLSVRPAQRRPGVVELLRVQVRRGRAEGHEHRPGAEMADGRGGRGKGERAGEDNLLGLQADRRQGQVQPGG